MHLRKLKTQHLPLETLAKIFKCELSLASEPANHHRLLEEGLLEVIAKSVFVDLPARFGLASLSVLGALDVEVECSEGAATLALTANAIRQAKADGKRAAGWWDSGSGILG